MKKIIYSLLVLSSLIYVSLAQVQLPQVPPNPQGGSGSNVGQSLLNLVVQGSNIVNALYISLFTVALVLFSFGLFRYFFSKDAAQHKEGWKYMGFGIVAIFVMVAIWGIVVFISQTTGIGIGGGTLIPSTPQLQIQPRTTP